MSTLSCFKQFLEIKGSTDPLYPLLGIAFSSYNKGSFNSKLTPFILYIVYTYTRLYSDLHNYTVTRSLETHYTAEASILAFIFFTLIMLDV
jgi:hypothetical protein